MFLAQTAQVEDEASWRALHSGVVTGLREYLNAIAVFSEVYAKVWAGQRAGGLGGSERAGGAEGGSGGQRA